MRGAATAGVAPVLIAKVGVLRVGALIARPGVTPGEQGAARWVEATPTAPMRSWLPKVAAPDR